MTNLINKTFWKLPIARAMLINLVLVSLLLAACGDDTATSSSASSAGGGSSSGGSSSAGSSGSGVPPVSGTEVKNASGLRYIDVKVGTGAEAKNGTAVSVHYTGYLTNGKKFDSSLDRGTPFGFRLPGQVITGWNEGIPGMKVGGKRRLLIPAALGYGASGFPPVIPANSELVFDVELLDVK